MSGGQQQRVGIARAVAMDPKVLLLDEITSALDPELVGEVLEVVQKLVEDGMTMIIVTHEMSFASDVSNRIVFMDQGKIEIDGTPSEIFESKNKRLNTFLARISDLANSLACCNCSSSCGTTDAGGTNPLRRSPHGAMGAELLGAEVLAPVQKHSGLSPITK